MSPFKFNVFPLGKNIFVLNLISNSGYLIMWALRVAASASGGPVAVRAWRCRLACGPASGFLAAQPRPQSASVGAAASLGLGVGAWGRLGTLAP